MFKKPVVPRRRQALPQPRSCTNSGESPRRPRGLPGQPMTRGAASPGQGGIGVGSKRTLGSSGSGYGADPDRETHRDRGLEEGDDSLEVWGRAGVAGAGLLGFSIGGGRWGGDTGRGLEGDRGGEGEEGFVEEDEGLKKERRVWEKKRRVRREKA
ncbi:uncharacterized protein A4U43_C05F10160 [Asparagus officinalis]|uniref:Uncharacterized protein n=1 Tax=Asparagus officinalis TaxID=4686 RepID=A0A5P1EQM9_ASPOF|nr:uncharacterized protein A4U43_C05F10160 [Asparagus officinalis]